MISGFKAELSNNEKQSKIMLVNSDPENLLKEKTACYSFAKEAKRNNNIEGLPVVVKENKL
jgi:hypothetical protein